MGKMKFYKVFIYKDLKGYVAAPNIASARIKVIKDKKYRSALWIGKSGKPTNLKIVAA